MVRIEDLRLFLLYLFSLVLKILILIIRFISLQIICFTQGTSKRFSSWYASTRKIIILGLMLSRPRAKTSQTNSFPKSLFCFIVPCPLKDQASSSCHLFLIVRLFYSVLESILAIVEHMCHIALHNNKRVRLRLH
jgi:hypothetical protein